MSTLEKMLRIEIKKQKCLDSFRHPVQQVEETPFPSFQPLGWFETLVRQALKKIHPRSAKWPAIASTYTTVTGNSFSNYVLGFLCKGSDPDLISIDTFAYVLRYWKTKSVFLIEGLDAISPVDLWLEMILSVPSIPLWKAILGQYRFLEQSTGNLFLSLTTEDAAEYYVRTCFPEEPYINDFKGSISEKPFVLGTYNFKQLLETI